MILARIQRIAPPVWLLLLSIAAAVIEWVALASPYMILKTANLPRRSFARLASYELSAGAWLALAYLALTLIYLLALHLFPRSAPAGERTQAPGETPAAASQRRRRALKPLLAALPWTALAIWAGWAIQAAVLIWVHPGESLDIYEYIFRGHMIAELGVSPLTVAPKDVPIDWLTNRITWYRVVDSYGPVWEAISGATTLLGVALNPRPWIFPDVLGRLLAYRLLAIGASAGCGALIWRMLRHSQSRSIADLGLLLWLWNPLGLLVTVVGGHNDALMLLFVLLGARFIQHGRHVPALLMLILAAHIKVTALLFLPVWLIWMLRQRSLFGLLRTLALTVVFGLPLSWLLYRPFGGWESLPGWLAARAPLLTTSLGSLAFIELPRSGWPTALAEKVATRGATLYFSVASLYVLWRLWRSRSEPADLWRAMRDCAALYLLIGAYWFQEWYVLWALAPAALLPQTRSSRLDVTLLGLGAMWTNLAIDFLSRGNSPALTLRPAEWVAYGVLLAPLLALALGALALRVVRRVRMPAATFWRKPHPSAAPRLPQQEQGGG